MKKLFALICIAALLVATGCATTGSTRAKCPACGYEFEAETN